MSVTRYQVIFPFQEINEQMLKSLQASYVVFQLNIVIRNGKRVKKHGPYC